MIYDQPVNTKEKHYLYHGTPDKIFIPEVFDPAQCVQGLWLTDHIDTALSYRKCGSENEDIEASIGGLPATAVMEKFEKRSFTCDPESYQFFTDICSLAEFLEIDWSVEKLVRHVTEEAPEKRKALEYILHQGIVTPGRTLIVEVKGSLEESWAESSDAYHKDMHVGVKEPSTRKDGKFNYHVYDYSRVRIVGEVL